jgi:hypothetical protein
VDDGEGMVKDPTTRPLLTMRLKRGSIRWTMDDFDEGRGVCVVRAVESSMAGERESDSCGGGRSKF